MANKAYLTDKQLNIIRGKNLVGKASKEEIFKVFAHLDQLHDELDERDGEDYFGTEGWRHAFNHPDED